MTEEDLSVDFVMPGKRFIVTGHDYRFEGTIQTIFRKRNGKVRCVIESDDGVCLIQNLSNVRPLTEPDYKLPNVPDGEE